MPKAANPTPTLSTAKVPPKFCMMMRWQRREILMVSTNRRRLLPISMIFALSRATSVPDPIAIPTVACISAGASLIPSPTMATFLPLFTSCLMTSLF